MASMSNREESPGVDEDLSRPKQHIVFCVLILLVNVASLLVILTSSYLRKMVKFHVWTGMSLANIVSSLAYFPINIHIVLNRPSQSLSPWLISLLETTDLFFFPSITCLGLVAVAADYIVNRCALCDKTRNTLSSIVGSTFPWLYGMAAFIPSLFKPVYFHPYPSPNFADVTVKSDFFIGLENSTPYRTNNVTKELAFYPVTTYSFVTFILMWNILPLCGTCVVMLCACVMKFVSTPISRMNYNPENAIFTAMPLVEVEEDDLRPKHVLDIVLASIVVIGFTAPNVCHFLSGTSCSPNGYCAFSDFPQHSLQLLKWSVAFIVPTIWMIDDRFRDASARACGKLFMKSCVVY